MRRRLQALEADGAARRTTASASGSYHQPPTRGVVCMTAAWPEGGFGDTSFGELFDEALRPKTRSYVLLVPTSITDQGAGAVKAWIEANHPGYPVVVAPEPLSLEELERRWCAKPA